MSDKAKNIEDAKDQSWKDNCLSISEITDNNMKTDIIIFDKGFTAGANYGYELAQEKITELEQHQKDMELLFRRQQETITALSLRVKELEQELEHAEQRDSKRKKDNKEIQTKLTTLEAKLQEAEKVIEYVAKPRSGYVGQLLEDSINAAKAYLHEKKGANE